MEKRIILFSFLFLILISFISAGIEDLVITEVKIATGEYLEIYNPSDIDIFLCENESSCVYVAYFSQKNDWNKISVLNHAIPGEIKIKSKSYIGIGFYDYANLDWQPYSTQRLSNTNGAIGIFTCNPNGKTISEAKDCLIDLVSWGKMNYVKLGTETKAPNSKEILVRKFNLETNTYQNTKNNAEDFFICDSPSPGDFNSKCYSKKDPTNSDPSPTTNENSSEEDSPEEELVDLTPQKVNLNNATLEELMKIVGLGGKGKIAQDIIDARPFCSLEDLLKVKGIGNATLENIKLQGLAFVDPCESEEDEEIVELTRKETKTETTESVLNLAKPQTIKESSTEKVIYQSKTEVIRKYSIYFFSALLVVIIFLIIKK